MVRRQRAQTTARGIILRAFHTYASEHKFSISGAAKGDYCVPVETFHAVAALAVKAQLNMQLSDLYVDSVLHNTGIQTWTVQLGGTEEKIYVATAQVFQKLLTL